MYTFIDLWENLFTRLLGPTWLFDRLFGKSEKCQLELLMSSLKAGRRFSHVQQKLNVANKFGPLNEIAMSWQPKFAIYFRWNAWNSAFSRQAGMSEQ